MTHLELKQVILDYIRELYKREFIGQILIEDLNPVGYKVSFNFDKSENPLVIIADLPDKKFLSYIKEEIRKSKFHRTKYFGATKLPPIKPKLCYERERINRQNKRCYF